MSNLSKYKIGDSVFICDMYGSAIPGTIISGKEYKKISQNRGTEGAKLWYDFNSLPVKYGSSEVAVSPIDEIFCTLDEVMVFKLMNI